MSVKIQLRRDTSANWTSTNPILHQGELGVEYNTGKMKLGDGSTAWNSLAYFTGDLSSLGSLAYLNAAPAGTLTGTTLASNVVNSSLTSVGTLSSLNVSGTATVGTLSTSNAAITGGTITGMPNPTSGSDVANKTYVDNLVSGFTQKSIADAVSTSNLSATYANGSSGVGATLTANANGALVVDGVTVAVNNIVLVIGQSTAADNGIYTVTATGDGSNPFVLTRATYYDQTSEIKAGDFVVVRHGTVNEGTIWVNTETDPVTIGTDAINFTLYQTPMSSVDANNLTGTTLASNVIHSSLTSVGTLTNLTVTNPISGSVTGNAGTVTNGVYTTDTGTVTNTMLAGSISNAKLLNSSVTVNGVSIALGASGTVTAAAGTLTGTTLASNVVASSLTSVGTLTNLHTSGSLNLDGGNITSDGSGNLTAVSFSGAIDGGTA